MFTLYCTKKLLDRVRPEIHPDPVACGAMFGQWYATAWFWRPQLTLLIHEQTLLPVVMPLAPATTLAQRFAAHLAEILRVHGIDEQTIRFAVSQMSEVQFTKTSNRSLVGMLNQFTYLAEGYRDYSKIGDWLTLSLKLSQTPCSPKHRGCIFPDRELHRWVDQYATAQSGLSGDLALSD